MSEAPKTSFWTTLPGILTGVAAVITAATGAYLGFRKAGPDLKPGIVDSVPKAPPAEPAFLRQGSFHDPELAEFVLGPNPSGLRDTLGFLKLTDAAYGTTNPAPGSAPDVFRFELTLTNTTAAPLTLDMASRYFSLDDDRGRAATLLYFCCPASGTLLPPGQSRTLILYFQSADWYGKSVQAHLINFRITGLLPIERALWQVRPLATAA